MTLDGDDFVQLDGDDFDLRVCVPVTVFAVFPLNFVLYMHNMNFICPGLDIFVAKI